MNTIEALRALLAQIDEMDTAVFEAALDETLENSLRRHLSQMGHMVSDELAGREQALVGER
jgi:hypothetical protein